MTEIEQLRIPMLVEAIILLSFSWWRGRTISLVMRALGAHAGRARVRDDDRRACQPAQNNVATQEPTQILW
jgi:hypothetical protein